MGNAISQARRDFSEGGILPAAQAVQEAPAVSATARLAQKLGINRFPNPNVDPLLTLANTATSEWRAVTAEVVAQVMIWHKIPVLSQQQATKGVQVSNGKHYDLCYIHWPREETVSLMPCLTFYATNRRKGLQLIIAFDHTACRELPPP